MAVRQCLVLVALTLAWVSPGLAQQQPSLSLPLELGRIVSPVLTIDSDRLYIESAFGRRVEQETAEKGAELTAENAKIQAELEAEELALTQRRPSLSPEEFRGLADEFDTKVRATRAAQTAKVRAIDEAVDRQKGVFLTAAIPVLERLMKEAGAVVIIERRNVFLGVEQIDITEDAIALLDEALGNGDPPN